MHPSIQFGDDVIVEPVYDPDSQVYKEALREKLMAQRPTRCQHLPATWFHWLVCVLLTFSSALWIEGSPAGRIKGFIFDLEPKPGA